MSILDKIINEVPELYAFVQQSIDKEIARQKIISLLKCNVVEEIAAKQSIADKIAAKAINIVTNFSEEEYNRYYAEISTKNHMQQNSNNLLTLEQHETEARNVIIQDVEQYFSNIITLQERSLEAIKKLKKSNKIKSTTDRK